MKQKDVTLPKGRRLVKTEKCLSGKAEILLNEKTRQHEWRIISRNGYTVCSATGLNSVNSCVKGMKATEKILYDLLCSPRK